MSRTVTFWMPTVNLSATSIEFIRNEKDATCEGTEFDTKAVTLSLQSFSSVQLAGAPGGVWMGGRQLTVEAGTWVVGVNFEDWSGVKVSEATDDSVGVLRARAYEQALDLYRRITARLDK